MKIVVIGSIYPFRGSVAQSNTLLCLNLAKRHDVTSFSFKRLYPKFLFPGRTQRYESKKRLDFPVLHIIDSINPLNWLRVFYRIKKINPDLVILQWWATFLAPFSFILLSLLRLFTKIKICILCQNVLQHEKRFFDSFFMKMVFRLGHYFVVMSSNDLKDLKKIIPNAKAEIYVEPTYDGFFVSEQIPKSVAKKKLGLKGRVILFFGLVRPYKGLLYLLDAMPKVLKEIKLTLLIVGEFWYDKKDYFKKIEDNKLSKHVRIVDRYIPDEEVPLYLSAADVWVMPYVTATQSAALQTAFGFNKPIITTSVGSLLDLVDNNKTGLLVPPKNSEKLAEAIIDFYKDKKESKFIRNIKRSKKVFEWNEDKERIFFRGL